MDILSILIVLVIIGVVVLFFFVVGPESQAPRRADAWAHVVSLIGGTERRGKISGSYQGRAVEVFLADHGDETTFYYYHLRLKVPIRGFDWTIRFDTTTFLDPTKRWHIKSSEEALKQKLTDAGALELVKQAAGRPDVRYRADKGTLEYERYVGEDTYVPTPDEFAAQLNLLTRLADLNEELNVW
ncbi:MAG: hypothetical protein ACJ74W_21930 [Pyrinomonadaceae bacterium]